MDKVRFGIVGIGNMGSGHAKTLLSGAVERAELTAVCDINPARLDWAKENLPETVARFDDAEKLYASGLVDCVIIATPHYFHPPLTIAAFKAGLHAICEKPAGVYTKQVLEMNEAAAKYGKVFSMDFNQRTNPCYQKLREMVRGGELGELKRVNWIITDWFRTQAYYNSGGWRATWAGEGGGVLINQNPHQIDLLQWTCGMPNRMRAFCQEGRFHDIEVEDSVTAYFEYPNGATGVFITTTGEYPGTNRFEVAGTLGKVVIEGTTLEFYKNEVSDEDFIKNAQGGFGRINNEKIVYEFPDRGPQHKGIMQNVVNAILDGEELLGNGVEGINGLQISNAMHLSSWLDQWVDIPVDANLYLAELQKRIDNSTFVKVVEEKTEDTSGTY
ncbi:MAG: Gfo/Idh/MocA family oxidoreductase [Clostridia bacterium]|nr:Gfo/Idh/MocA family oxidoreductase [Clostridia bacterium]